MTQQQQHKWCSKIKLNQHLSHEKFHALRKVARAEESCMVVLRPKQLSTWNCMVEISRRGATLHVVTGSSRGAKANEMPWLPQIVKRRTNFSTVNERITQAILSNHWADECL